MIHVCFWCSNSNVQIQKNFLKNKSTKEFSAVRIVEESQDCYGTPKKLLRNCEYSKSDDFKKLLVLTQILGFL